MKHMRIVPAQVLGAAQRLRQEGKTDAAIALLRTAIKQAPQRPEFQAALAGALVQDGQVDAAVKALKVAIRLRPDWAEAHCQLAGTLLRIDALTEAETAARNAMRLQPERPENHITLALVLRQQGQQDDAETVLRSLLAMTPNIAEGWRQYGVLLLAARRYAEAEVAMRRALNLAPQDTDTYLSLARIFLTVDRPVEAEALAREACKRKPDSLDSLLILAQALGMLHRHNDAFACMQKALANAPEDPTVHLRHALTLRGAERVLDAEAALLGRHAESGEWFAGAILLLEIWIEKGETDKVMALGEKLLSTAPENYSLLMNLVWYLLRLGQVAQAEGILEKAQRQAPLAAGANIARYWAQVFAESRQEAWQTLQALSQAYRSGRHDLKTSKLAYKPRMALLLPVGRSGSLFLHSLFDGHPDVATLPGIFFKGFFGQGVWEKLFVGYHDPSWRRLLVERIIYYWMPLFDASRPNPVFGRPMSNPLNLGRNTGLTKMGENRDETFKLNEQAFAAHLLALLEAYDAVDPGLVFSLIHKAYQRTLHWNSTPELCFYHIHNPDPFELSHCLLHHPQARIVLLIREPVQSLESWFRVCWPDNEMAGPELIVKAWATMASMLTVMLESIRYLPAEYQESCGVRLEDIKRNPQQTMRALAAFLGIADHPSLYESTFQGMKYWGPESKLNPVIQGFDAASISRSVGVILTGRDAEIFQVVFYPLSAKYGYCDADDEQFIGDLNRLESSLDQPFGFEEKLYSRLGDYGIEIQDLAPYRTIRAQLKTWWGKLRSGVAFKHIVPPLAIDENKV